MKIIIFLKNKLISADAVTPLIMELRRRLPSLKAEFVILDKSTEAGLRKNMVLWEAMSSVGRITVLARHGRSWRGHILHRFKIIPALLRYSMLLLLRRAVLFHFGQIGASPLRFLSKFAGKNDLFVDAAFANITELQNGFDEIVRPREVASHVFHAPRVLAFNSGSKAYREARARSASTFLMGPPHLMLAWNEYIAQNAARYLNVELEGMPHADKPIVAFMLGYLGHLDFMRDSDALLGLFEETLDVLLLACPETPILIKPHVITDMKVINGILERKANPLLKISYLHPSVLLNRAAFFIANYYSTTLSTASALGCPTVEYTDYSNAALALSRGGSMRPDSVSHFIPRDKRRLAEVAQELVSRDWRPTAVSENSPVDGSFIDFLERKAPSTRTAA
jgi:hypothetical protein